MKAKSLTLPAADVALFEAGRTQFRVPLKPQPSIPESGGFWYPDGNYPRRWSMYYVNEDHFRDGCASDFARFRPGEPIEIKSRSRPPAGVWVVESVRCAKFSYQPVPGKSATRFRWEFEYTLRREPEGGGT
jgi:hypothetical protein